MGIVFAAIILLSWVMSLLTLITADKGESSSAGSASVVEDDTKARAAAVAVAVAVAEQQACRAHLLDEPPTTIVSAWQLGMRTNQLYEKRAPTIHKPRKLR